MNASELALWRYSVIAPLLHAAANVPLVELARRLAAEPKLGPDGRVAILHRRRVAVVPAFGDGATASDLHGSDLEHAGETGAGGGQRDRRSGLSAGLVESGHRRRL